MTNHPVRATYNRILEERKTTAEAQGQGKNPRQPDKVVGLFIANSRAT